MNMFGVKQRGLTLIELLVIIAIIGILISVVVVSLGGARAGGRDTKRQTNIRQISTALELYYNENIAYVQSAVMPTSIGTFLSQVPKDSESGSSPYGWVDNSVSGGNDDQDYCVYAILEKPPATSGNTVYFIAGPTGVTEKELSSSFVFILDNCE